VTSEMLDLSFLAVVDNREKYKVFPKRYDLLFRIRRVKVSVIYSSRYGNELKPFQIFFSVSSSEECTQLVDTYHCFLRSVGCKPAVSCT